MLRLSSSKLAELHFFQDFSKQFAKTNPILCPTSFSKLETALLPIQVPIQVLETLEE